MRDFTLDQEAVTPRLESLRQRSIKSNLKLLSLPEAPASLPSAVDLRPWFSPIEVDSQQFAYAATPGGDARVASGAR